MHSTLIGFFQTMMKLDSPKANAQSHFSNVMTENAFHLAGSVTAKKIALMVKMKRNVLNAMALLGSVV